MLWIALAINAIMCGVEMVAGITAESASLKADALDFLGDAANCAISVAVTGLALKWQARAALVKGTSIVLLGLWIMGSTVWMAAQGFVPTGETIGIMGILAVVANLACAAMLWRHREGDANRRSVWICSRNDAIANIAMVAAALGVLGTGTGWPDILAAAAMAARALSGGWQINRQARRELTGSSIPRRTDTARPR